MICYKKTNGQAHDLRFCIVPDTDDILLSGDVLPNIMTLHDPSYLSQLASQAAQQTQNIADATAAKAYTKLNTLMAMTPAQVQTWVINNVTTLAAAQDAITTLAIAVGVLARRL